MYICMYVLPTADKANQMCHLLSTRLQGGMKFRFHHLHFNTFSAVIFTWDDLT